jgi:anti-sigma factor RsiW
MPMDCNRVRDLLAAYLDNELSAEERVEVEAHLSACAGCRKALDSMRKAQDAVRSLLTERASGQEPSPGSWEHLRPELDVYRPSLLFLFRKRKWRIIATVIFIALALAGVLWAFGVWR